ncbi:hypothetical protein V8E54_013539 [Elaphomyces granulatus]
MEHEQDFDDLKQATAFIHWHSVTTSTTSTAASSTSVNAATNVTDVSPEPAILQIQDNDNDLDERPRLSGYCDGCYHCHYDSYCDGRYNGQDSCCDGNCDCSYDPTTKAGPPEELKCYDPTSREHSRG